MIEVRELTAGYAAPGERGEPPVISIAAETFSAGKITTVIGKNGSGKSTFLKTLVGLLPYRGSIRCDKRELRTLSPKERAACIGYLPQTLTAPHMDVRTLVAHGCFRRKKMFRSLGESDREQIAAALRIADLAAYGDKQVPALSGGERQRAFLAMLIAQDPAFFLLDEVTSYMDIAHQKATVELVRYLAAAGKGVLMTSHDLALSFTVSDRILVMDEGRMILSGTPEELLEERDTLRRCFGICLGRTSSANALYAYELQN